MRHSTAIMIVFAISAASLAAIIVVLFDIYAGDGATEGLHSSASYLASPSSALVFAILFLGGGALSAAARSTTGAVALLPTLGLAFAPVVLDFHEGLRVPHGAIVAFMREFKTGDANSPCPPGWTAVKEMAGKMPLGAGSGKLKDGTALTTRILGDSAGEEEHKLTTPELPDHDHDYKRTNYDDDPSIGTGVVHASSGVYGVNIRRVGIYEIDDFTGKQGGNNAHNNMPPYLVVQFCMLD